MIKSALSQFIEDATWASLARVALWTVLFLCLFGVLFHVRQPDTTQAPSIVHMMLPNDINPFESATQQKNPDKTNIAWITDSTNVIMPAEFIWRFTDSSAYSNIATKVGDILDQTYGQHDININLYLQKGPGLANTLNGVFQALGTAPDMLIMSLNPTRIFNDYAAFIDTENYREILGKNSLLWAAYPALRGWVFTFTQPSHLLWSVSGRHLPVIRNAYLYKKGFLLYATSSWNLDFNALTRPPAQRLVNHETFWICADRALTKENCWPYIEALKRSTPDDLNTLSARIMLKTIDILKEQKIPTLLYLSPLYEEATRRQDEQSLEKYKHMQQSLKALSDRYQGTSVQIIYALPENIRQTVRYKPFDLVHMTDPGQFDGFLASKIAPYITSISQQKDRRP